MTAEETAGQGFIRAFHPDDAEDVLARYGAAVRLGTSIREQSRIRAADGSYRWFLNRAQPGRDAEGRIVRWAGSLTDIDDLIRAEERLRENELRFRTMISAVPSLTFEADVDGNNIFVSDQWLAYTGMTAEETAGRGFIRAIIQTRPRTYCRDGSPPCDRACPSRASAAYGRRTEATAGSLTARSRAAMRRAGSFVGQARSRTLTT